MSWDGRGLGLRHGRDEPREVGLWEAKVGGMAATNLFSKTLEWAGC